MNTIEILGNIYDQLTLKLVSLVNEWEKTDETRQFYEKQILANLSLVDSEIEAYTLKIKNLNLKCDNIKKDIFDLHALGNKIEYKSNEELYNILNYLRSSNASRKKQTIL